MEHRAEGAKSAFEDDTALERVDDQRFLATVTDR